VLKRLWMCFGMDSRCLKKLESPRITFIFSQEFFSFDYTCFAQPMYFFSVLLS
jgi:hypothetical protein